MAVIELHLRPRHVRFWNGYKWARQFGADFITSILHAWKMARMNAPEAFARQMDHGPDLCEAHEVSHQISADVAERLIDEAHERGLRAGADRAAFFGEEG